VAFPGQSDVDRAFQHEHHFLTVAMGMGVRAGGAAWIEKADIDLERADRLLRHQRLAVAVSPGQGRTVAPAQDPVQVTGMVLEKVGDRDRQRFGDLHQGRDSRPRCAAPQLAQEACRGAGPAAKVAQRQFAGLTERLEPLAHMPRLG